MLHSLSHLLGLDNASGSLYLFWSGFFGDVTIFAALFGLYFHHNCRVKGCLRWGKHKVGGSSYCTKHHKGAK